MAATTGLAPKGAEMRGQTLAALVAGAGLATGAALGVGSAVGDADAQRDTEVTAAD